MPALTNVTPVRFAKGDAIPVAASLALDGAHSKTVGPLDVRSFEAVQVLVELVGGDIISNQTYLPQVIIRGSVTPQGSAILIDDTSSNYQYPATNASGIDVYTVGNLLPYLEISVQSYAVNPPPGAGATDGVWNVTIVPIVLSPKIRVEGVQAGPTVEPVVVATDADRNGPLYVTDFSSVPAPVAGSPVGISSVASKIYELNTIDLSSGARLRFQNVGSKTAYLQFGPTSLTAADISTTKYGIRLQVNEVYEMARPSRGFSVWAICAPSDISSIAIQAL